MLLEGTMGEEVGFKIKSGDPMNFGWFLAFCRSVALSCTCPINQAAPSCW